MVLSSSIDSLYRSGQERYAQAQYAEAGAVWRRALAAVRERGDVEFEARVLTDLGLVAYNLGDYELADATGRNALRLKEEHGFAHLRPRSLNALGLSAWQRGRLTDAADLFERARAAAVEIGDPEYDLKPRANLGLIYQEFGDFPRARAAYQSAVEGSRELEDVRSEARSLVNLASLEIQAGDPARALEWLEQASALGLADVDPTAEEQYWGQLASAYLDLGEPRRLYAALDSAGRRARAQGLREAEAANLYLLAESHRIAGDRRRALDLFRESEALHREVGLAIETGNDLLAQARIHAESGNTLLAHERASRALGIHQQTEAAYEELADRMVLAELAGRLDRHEEFETHLGAAQALAEAMNVPATRRFAALSKARFAARRGDAAAILVALEEVAPDLARAGYAELAEAERLRARAYLIDGDVERSAQSARRAVDALERIRGRYGSELLRGAFTTSRAGAYIELVEVLLRAGRLEEAFEVADGARGRVLLEHIRARRRGGTSRAAERAALEGDALLRRVARLVASIDEYEKFDMPVDELVAELETARRDYELHVIRQREADSPDAGLLGDRPTNPDDVRSALRQDEALILYLVAPERVIGFVGTRAGLESFSAEISRDELAYRVRLARDLVGDRTTPPEAPREVLEGLYDLLVRPVHDAGTLKGVTRLVLVPHDALAYLPFAALRDGAARRYLVEDYELLHVPSAASLTALRGRSSPVAAGAPSQAAAFAPLPSALPASPQEARSVAEALEGARRYVGRDASESRFRDALSGGGIVHLASHGRLDPRSPMFSWLELATPARAAATASSTSDGKFQVHELLDLSVRSPLVFLSGCDTALGAGAEGRTPGEDYATLARAFLYAGARNVVATLWPIEDAAAAELASGFYGRLGEADALSALTRAQRELIGQPARTHPYYWAAYRLSGDGAFSRLSAHGDPDIRT